MRSSHSTTQKKRTDDSRAAQTVGFRSIIPAQLTGAVCISTIVGGVLLCPGIVHAQSQADPSGPVQSVNGPTVAILQPTYADILRGHVSVLISVQTNKFAPKSVEMFVDGRSATGGPQELDASPSTGFDWDTTIFTDGPHRLTVRVTDTQGFIGQSEVQVYINNGHKRDDTAPSISWLNVNDGDVMKGTVHINLKAADDFGVKYIFVSINPAATPKQKPALHEYFLNRPPYSIAFDTTALPDGLYVLDALAYDALENEGKAPEREFGILNNGINPTMTSTLSALSARGLQTAQQEAASPAAPAAENAAPTTLPNLPTYEAGLSAPTVSSGGTAAKAPDIRIAENTQQRMQPVQTPSQEAPAPDALSFVPHVPVGAVSDPQTLSDRALMAPKVQSPARSSFSVASLTTRSVPKVVAESPRIAAAPRAMATAPKAVVKTASPHSGASAVPAAEHAPRTGVAAMSAPTEYAFNLAPSAPSPGAPAPLAGQSVAAQPGMSLGDLGPLAPRFSAEDAAVTWATPLVPEPMVALPLENSPGTASLEAARTTAPRLAERPQPWLGASTYGKQTLGAAALHSADAPSLQLWPESPASRISIGRSAIEPHSNPLRMSAPYSALKERSMARFATASAAATAMPAIDIRQQTLPTRGSRISPASAGTAGSPKSSRVAPSRVTAFAALPQRIAPHNDARPAIVIIGSRYDERTAHYLVSKDEPLAVAAARMGVTPALLASVNGLPENTRVAAGTKLAVPRTFSVSYAGKQVQTDVPGVMVGSTSTAAFRFLFQAQGGKVDWDGAHHRVIATNGDQQVTLEIGSRTATVNDKKVMMDLAAYLLSGRTMVPVRLFEKALNAKVEWEPSSGRMLVSIDNSKHVG